MGAKGLNPFKENDVEYFFKNVPYKKLEELEKDIAKVYGKYWIEAGAGKKQIAKIDKMFSSAKARAAFDMGKAGRMNGVLKILTALGIFGVIEDNFAFAANMAGDHDEFQAGAWKEFEIAYRTALDKGLKRRAITNKDAHDVRKTLIYYLRSIKAPEDYVNKLDYAMGAWIDLNIP